MIQELGEKNRKPEIPLNNIYRENYRMIYAYEMGKYDFIKSLVNRLKREKEQDHG